MSLDTLPSEIRSRIFDDLLPDLKHPLSITLIRRTQLSASVDTSVDGSIKSVPSSDSLFVEWPADLELNDVRKQLLYARKLMLTCHTIHLDIAPTVYSNMALTISSNKGDGQAILSAFVLRLSTFIQPMLLSLNLGLSPLGRPNKETQLKLSHTLSQMTGLRTLTMSVRIAVHHRTFDKVWKAQDLRTLLAMQKACPQLTHASWRHSIEGSAMFATDHLHLLTKQHWDVTAYITLSDTPLCAGKTSDWVSGRKNFMGAMDVEAEYQRLLQTAREKRGVKGRA